MNRAKQRTPNRLQYLYFLARGCRTKPVGFFVDENPKAMVSQAVHGRSQTFTGSAFYKSIMSFDGRGPGAPESNQPFPGYHI